MNVTDFGHMSDRDHTRGACQWVDGKEWCGKACVVADYRGNFNPPTGYKYGALYGIHIPDGIPEYESMWICIDHRADFLYLNGVEGATVWEMNHRGMGDKVSPRFIMHDCPNCGGHEEPIRKGELV